MIGRITAHGGELHRGDVTNEEDSDTATLSILGSPADLSILLPLERSVGRKLLRAESSAAWIVKCDDVIETSMRWHSVVEHMEKQLHSLVEALIPDAR